LPLTPFEAQLLRLSKSNQKQLKAFRDGVYITSTTGRSLDDLRDQATSDRLDFAEACLSVGNKLMRTRPIEYRAAIGRFYYAMYHAMRATVFYANDGDDYQRHETLPQHTPSDFPSNAVWENRLKNARGYRNDADYDPYPIAAVDFSVAAKDLQGHAHTLLLIVRTYLRAKGCGHV